MTRFKLYNEANSALIFEFPLVQSSNHPQSPMRKIVIEGVRGTGALVIPAGTVSWDLEIKGILYIDGATEGYEELVVLMDAMESAIVANVNYTMRIYKDGSNYYSYHVRRIEAIEWENDSLRTDKIDYTVTLKVNAW